MDYSALVKKNLSSLSEQDQAGIKTAEDYYGIKSATDAYYRIMEKDSVVSGLTRASSMSDTEYLRHKLMELNPVKTPSQIQKDMAEYMAEDGVTLAEESKGTITNLRNADKAALDKKQREIWAQANVDANETVQYVKRLNQYTDTAVPKIKVGDAEIEVDLSKRARYELNKFIHTGGLTDAINGEATWGEKGHEALAEAAMWLNPTSRAELIKGIEKATEERVKNKKP